MSQFYFAYGSNLCTSDWSRWCEQRGFASSGLSPVRPVFLPDHRLHFSHFSRSRSGGALNVLPGVGHVVEGVLMKADRHTWRALDRKEGAPSVYEAVEKTVLDENGSQFSAIVYVLRRERIQSYVAPTEEYVKVVRKGLEEFGLCTDALMAAATNEEPRLFTDAVFTYGTLMRGECRFDSLAQFGIEAALMGAIPGTLVDLGSYPGLLPNDAAVPRGCVDGDFVRVSDVSNALKKLDQIEGFDGFGPESLYIRRLTPVDVGGRCRWAWTYEYNLFVDSAKSVIENGSWRQHTGVEASFFDRVIRAHVQKASFHDLIARLRQLCPFDAELPEFPRSITQLADAIRSGRLDERRLAQASGNWLAGVR